MYHQSPTATMKKNVIGAESIKYYTDQVMNQRGFWRKNRKYLEVDINLQQPLYQPTQKQNKMQF